MILLSITCSYKFSKHTRDLYEGILEHCCGRARASERPRRRQPLCHIRQHILTLTCSMHIRFLWNTIIYFTIDTIDTYSRCKLHLPLKFMKIIYAQFGPKINSCLLFLKAHNIDIIYTSKANDTKINNKKVQMKMKFNFFIESYTINISSYYILFLLYIELSYNRYRQHVTAHTHTHTHALLYHIHYSDLTAYNTITISNGQ